MIVFGHANYENFGNANRTEWSKVYNELFGENSHETDIKSFSESLEMYAVGSTIWNLFQI
jgi:hypothetical protein